MCYVQANNELAQEIDVGLRAGAFLGANTVGDFAQYICTPRNYLDHQTLTLYATYHQIRICVHDMGCDITITVDPFGDIEVLDILHLARDGKHF